MQSRPPMNFQAEQMVQNFTMDRPRHQERVQLPSVYVGNLPTQSFYDLDLYKYFTSRGYKVSKSKVVLDKATSKPRGYGYLTFYTQQEADKVILEMNNQILDGQAIRLSHQIQRGEQKYDEKANILIKNIDKEVTQQEIFSAFAKFGNIGSAKLESYPDGTSRGFAYIQFEKVEDADKAIEEMNGVELKGQKLAVNKHEKKETRPGQQPKFNNLFVGNLPAGTDEEKLRSLFQDFGEIESVYVQKDDKGTLKDSGFVCFKDPELAEKAADAMNKKQIGTDQFLIVNRHISKKDNEILQTGSKIHPISQNLSKTFNSNVYVKFIPNDITEEELRKTFSEAGKIISVKMDQRVQRFENQEIPQYQYAFILYEKVSDAQTAIRKFDNANIFGSRPLKVELWLSKEEIEQQKKAKENREVHQILNQIIKGVGQMGVGPQVAPGQPFQGGQPFPQGQGMPG